MYLAAQRVRSYAGYEGINAFFYTHGVADWVFPPDPDYDPGVLFNAITPIMPVGGNSVRSYLDVVAPDAALWHEIHRGLSAFVLDHFDAAMPWVGTTGRLRFRIAMDLMLAQNWRAELTTLLRATEAVRG